MIVSKKIKQLKANRDKSPILINKIDWRAIKHEKNIEKILRLLESFMINLVNFYCAVKSNKNYNYIEDG